MVISVLSISCDWQRICPCQAYLRQNHRVKNMQRDNSCPRKPGSYACAQPGQAYQRALSIAACSLPVRPPSMAHRAPATGRICPVSGRHRKSPHSSMPAPGQRASHRRYPVTIDRRKLVRIRGSRLPPKEDVGWHAISTPAAEPGRGTAMSPSGTKREFSPERLKGRKPPHCRRSGLNVGSRAHSRRATPGC